MSENYSSISEITGIVGRIFDNDEFILETSQGRVRVDADLRDSLTLDLTVGETVTVTGIYDDDDFDAMSIIRQDGSPVLTGNFRGEDWQDDNMEDFDRTFDYNHNNSYSGSVSEITGIVGAMFDNDEFILETSQGRVRVDADLRDSLTLDLTVEETVTVTGIYDNDDFDAMSITRQDGSPVLTKELFNNYSYDDSSNDLDDSYDDYGNVDDNRQQEIPNINNINTESENSDNNRDSLFNTPVYRFQNRNINGTYLFAGETESHGIRNNYGETFIEEGFAFRVANNPANNLEAIYRMANKDIPGTYLYVGEEEKQNISQNYTNFKNEGIAFYVLGVNANQGEDVYRFQSINNPGTYLFVLEQEKNNILANYSSQFTLEGVAFEVG
ncbi:hypothetical protein [Cyanobacterium sp. Dongsha4]|uniref:hypothetical protein n=1 Tax=Cyanobacterium sp. DS4 TaxID=2878255 RepID=UPI002E80FEA2|nr:hypothetical protein [Cyanobacterium sp. Dongsha4]WVK99714.1 hypothetical protein Dongsha4_13675 [Cyanobacterium sp. Dongsha4]